MALRTTGQKLTSTRNRSTVNSQETNASSNNQWDIPVLVQEREAHSYEKHTGNR